MKVCLFVNHACNLACSYCYNGRKFRRRMPWDVARRGVDLAMADPNRRVAMISFFGGEPLLEFELIQRAVAYAEQQAARTDKTLGLQVVTNGTRTSDDIVAFLSEHRFFVGVSIDGCRAAHDATRRYPGGRSSYNRVTAGVRKLLNREHSLGTRLATVIDPDNVAYLGESFDALLDLGGRNLAFNINYEAAWNEGARDDLVAALATLGDRYIAAYRRGERFTLSILDAKVITHLKGGYALTDRCDFGCEEVAVAPSGHLYPCDRLIGDDTADEVRIGHIDTGVDAARRDALIASKNRVLGDCDGCELLGRCMHWCGCVNHAMTGSVGEVDGLLCWFEQRIIEQADRCAAVLYGEDNEEFVRRFYDPRGRALSV